MITLTACIQSIGLLIIFEGCTDRKYARKLRKAIVDVCHTKSVLNMPPGLVWLPVRRWRRPKMTKTTTNVENILWVDCTSNRMFIWPNFKLPMFSNVFSCEMRNTPRRQDDWGRVDGLRSFKYEATFWSVYSIAAVLDSSIHVASLHEVIL